MGNQTKNPCGTAVYDGLDRTTTNVNNGDTAAKCGTAQTETVGYDGLGRQTTLSSTTGRTDTYRYGDMSQTVLTDDTNSPATTARYLQGPAGEALAAVDGNGSRQTLETDLQGSTVLTVGGTLPATCKARFDPWGDPEDPANPGGVCNNSGGTSANGRWYHQQQRDPATGNYQNGARTYNPATATWLTPDSYKTDGNPTSDLSVGVDPLTQNRYSYVNGNPINLRDPDGHFSIRDYCKRCEKVYNASNDWARDRFHDGVDIAKAGAEGVKDGFVDMVKAPIQMAKDGYNNGKDTIGAAKDIASGDKDKAREKMKRLKKRNIDTAKGLGKEAFKLSEMANPATDATRLVRQAQKNGLKDALKERAHDGGHFVPTVILIILTDGAGTPRLPDAPTVPEVPVPTELAPVAAETEAGATAPVGRLGSPMDVPAGTNVEAEIGGQTFGPHAIDQMQGRGIPPSAVNDAIANGQA